MTDHVEAPRYGKASDAQRLLGNIHRDTLRALVRDGVIDPPVQITRRLHLFDLTNIARVIEQRRRAAA
jgi:hypothetical protein